MNKSGMLAFICFTVISAVLLLRTTTSGGQKARELYLISGNPSNFGGGPFPTLLYRPENGSLKLVRELLAPQTVNFMRVYRDRQMICLGWDQEPNKFGIQVTGMNQLSSSHSFLVEIPPTCSVIQVTLLDVATEDVFGLHQWCRAALGPFYGRRLSGDVAPISWEQYRGCLLTGYSGAGFAGDYLEVRIESDGRVVKRLDETKKIDLPLKVPLDLAASAAGNAVMVVSNHQIRAVLSARLRNSVAGNNGTSTYLVYERKEDRWHSVAVPGARTYLREFGTWLAGTVLGPHRDVELPGASQRPKDDDPGGVPFDQRFNRDAFYSPGTLFLYSVTARRPYQLETGQADSEVLLVEGDQIWYRTSTQIMAARITPEGIKDQELVVEGRPVANVHWAFRH